MRTIGLLDVREADLRALALDAVEQYGRLRDIGRHLASYIARQTPPFGESTTDALVYRTPPEYRQEVKRLVSWQGLMERIAVFVEQEPSPCLVR